MTTAVFMCPRCQYHARTEISGGDTHRVLELVRCPGCGHRGHVWNAYWDALIHGYAFKAARLVFMIVLGMSLQGWLGALAVCLALVLATGWQVHTLALDTIEDADRAVRFVSSNVDCEPQVVGFACARCSQRISFQTDGRMCDCGHPVHFRCVGVHACRVSAPAASRAQAGS